jgi:hypothetical protein
MHYLYEGEYDPQLNQVSTPVVAGPKRKDRHYDFPHTCEPGCADDFKVCPHHKCLAHTCGNSCVNFVCEGCCPNWARSATPSPENLLLHAKMYEIGDKYDVVGLKQLAREKFSRGCAEHWNNEYFVPAAHYALSTTPEEDAGLRGLVADTLSTHMKLLNKPEIQALLNEHNGVAVCLLNLRAKELGWIKPSA